jgi:hypothetical protein
MKIQARSQGASYREDFGEIDITPKLGFNKKKQQQINRQKIESKHGVSKIEAHANREAFAPQKRFRDQLKEKIEKTKKLNMKKINKIKVKKVQN